MKKEELLLILISLFGAVLLLVTIKRRGWLLPVTAISLWLAVSIIVGGLVPAAVQRFRVIPDELNKELPYVENHIDYTRLAYGLDAIEEKSFEASPNLTKENIANNSHPLCDLDLKYKTQPSNLLISFTNTYAESVLFI